MKMMFKRILALGLSLSMVLSLTCLSSNAATEDTIITWGLTFGTDSENPGSSTNSLSVNKDDEFYAFINFSGNPTTDAETIQDLSLVVSYDTSKTAYGYDDDTLLDFKNSVAGATYDEETGVFLVGGGVPSGLTKKANKNYIIQASGAFWYVCFTALTDITDVADVIHLAESGMVSGVTKTTYCKDGAGAFFKLAGIPMSLNTLTLDHSSVTVEGSKAATANNVKVTPTLSSTGGSSIALSNTSFAITKGDDSFNWYSDGTITVPDNAEEGEYTVTATASAEGFTGSATATLTVTRAAEQLTVTLSSEAATLAIPESGSAEYTPFTVASVANQFGETKTDYTVTWSIPTAVSGVALTDTATGKISVASTVADGATVKLRATATSGNVTGYADGVATLRKLETLGVGSITLNVTAKTYDGAELADPTYSYGTYTDPGEGVTKNVSYTYAKKSGDTYEAPTADRPIDAGTYRVTMTYTDNYAHDSYPGSSFTTIKEVTISPATVTVTWDGLTDKTYNGSAQTAPTASVMSGAVSGETVTATVALTQKESGPELVNGAAVNAGDYTATATLSSANYTATNLTETFTIAKKDVTSSDFVVTYPKTGDANKVEYDGQAHTATAVAANGVTSLGTITVKHYKADSVVENPTNIGTYTVKVAIAAGDNYNAYAETETGSFEITKKAPTMTVSIANWTYGESAPKPVVTYDSSTYDGDVTFSYVGTGNTSYTASPTAPTAAGSYKLTATVAEQGNYSEGTADTTFTVYAKTLTADMITLSADSFTYSGSEQKPTVTVTDGRTLTDGTDYDVAITGDKLSSDHKSIDAGTYTVTVTGKGNYQSALTKTFSITKADQSPLELTSASTSATFGTDLTLATSGGTGDGAVTYALSFTASDGTTAPTGAATISGATLTPTKAGTVYVKATKAGDDNHNPVASAVTEITIGKATAPTGVAKTVSTYYAATAATTLDPTTFTNWPDNPSEWYVASVTADTTNAAQLTELTPVSNSDVSVKNASFKTSSNTEAGKTTTLTVTLKSQNYEDISATVTVNTVNKADITLNASATNVTYGEFNDWANVTVTGIPTGLEKVTDLTTSSENQYTLTYDWTYNATAASDYAAPTGHVLGDAGYYKVTVTYEDNAPATVNGAMVPGHVKEMTAEFQITKKALAESMVALSSSTFDYDGSAHTPTVTVSDMTDGKELVGTEDYAVTFHQTTANGETVAAADVKNVGTYYAVVAATDDGNYSGSASTGFTISPKTLNDSNIADIDAVTYNHAAHTPALTITDGTHTLVKDTDYTVTYSNNTNAGTATATVSFQGNYSGTAAKTFTINPKELTASNITAVAVAIYSGAAQEPALTIKDGDYTLTAGTDYTVAYSNNTNAYTDGNYAAANPPTATVTFTGNYTGTAEEKFPINRMALTASNITAVAESTYTGAELTPALTITDGSVTLVAGADYTVEYSNNINAGTGTATVTFTGNYMGTATKNFTIAPKAVTNPTIVFSPEKANYNNGAYVTPNVTVKDGTTEIDPSEYTLTWTGTGVTENKLTLAGTYTLTVTDAKTGTDTGNYTISDKVASFTVDKTAQTTALTISGAADKTYGDDPFEVTVGGGSGTGAYGLTASPADAVQITAPATGGVFTVSILKACETVTLTATKAGDDNFAAATEKTATFTIATKTLTASIATVDSKTYDGTTTGSGTLSLDGVKTGDDVNAGGTFTWASADAETTNVSVSGITLAGSAAANYTVAATLAEQEAPNGAKINKAPNDWATAPAANQLTYTGADQALVTAGTPNVSVATSDYQYALGENATTAPTTGWSSSISAGQDAGTYYVWCKVNETGNYSAIDATCVPVTIAPMPVTISWTADGNAIPASGKLPYKDGVAYTFAPTAKDSAGNPAPNLTLALDAENSTTPMGKTLLTDVATYTVKAKVATGMATNYSFPSNMGATTIEIVPATVTVDWKIGETAATSATYTGSAQTVSAVVKNGTTDVSDKFNVTVPTYGTSLTNAGEYSFTVAAKTDADAANYTLPTNATQTITIAKATRTIHVSTETTLTSHGEAVNATLTISADKDASAENAVAWSASPDGMVDVMKGTYTANSGTDSTLEFTLTPVTDAKGQTTVTFTLPATDNYEAATVTTSQKNTVTVDIKAGYNVTVGTITNGTVTPSVNVAKPNDTVTVTVAPATGYKLDTLTYNTMGEESPTDIEKNGETYSFRMGSADTVINATFAQETYAITKHSDSSSAAMIKVGSSTVGETEVMKAYNADVVLTVTASDVAVQKVELYKEDGTTLVKTLTAGADGTYSFKMPNYPVQVKATTAAKYTVSKNTAGDDNATIILSSGVDTLFAAKDATVTFKVAPTDKTSHTISSVTLSDINLTLTTVTTNSDGSAEYSFVMGSSNVAITAKQVAKTTIQTAVEETGANAIAAKTDTTVEKTEAEISVPVTKQAEDEIMAAAVNTKVEDSAASVLTDAMTSVGAANKIESDTDAKQQQATAIQALAQAGVIHVANDGTITESGNADAVNAVNIVNKVYMEAEVKDYDESKANTADASITMDVKPMTQQVATIEDVSGTYTLTEENSAPIAPATEMTISDPTQPIPMRMGITDTMAAAAQTYSASMIFIRHVHNAKTYEYRAMLQGSVGKWFILFVNYYGFSEFTLSLKPSSVASAQVSGERRYYTTFKDAVDAAVGTGAANVTVYLHKAPVDAGDKPTTIAAPLQITLDTSEKDVGYTPDFTDLYGRFAVDAAAMVKASTSENINNGIFKFVSNYTVEIAGASSVTVGGNTTLTATVKDSTSATYVPSGSDTLVWTSSNTGVATVDSDGKVTGVAAGSATITATFKKNNADPAFEGTKTITVTTSGSSSGGAAPATNVKAASGVKNGSVKFSTTNAKAGDKVTVTATPNQGYKVASVTVKDSKGNDVAVTKNADGTFSFTMPSGAVTVTPVFEKVDKSLSRFIDVDENAFYAKAVDWAVSNGITDGVSDTEFAPNDGCTRAQAVTFLYRAAGEPEAAVSASFRDVAADSYYAKAVAWAVANGITDGVSDTEFAPDAICTRAQIVTFLSRYEKAAATSASKFADVSADAYYAGAVGWAVANGITDGVSDTEFAPDAVCTRAHIVTFLYRDFVK